MNIENRSNVKFKGIDDVVVGTIQNALTNYKGIPATATIHASAIKLNNNYAQDEFIFSKIFPELKEDKILTMSNISLNFQTKEDIKTPSGISFFNIQDKAIIYSTHYCDDTAKVSLTGQEKTIFPLLEGAINLLKRVSYSSCMIFDKQKKINPELLEKCATSLSGNQKSNAFAIATYASQIKKLYEIHNKKLDTFVSENMYKYLSDIMIKYFK